MKLTISLSFVLVLLVPLCFMLDAGAGLLLQWDINFRSRQCIHRGSLELDVECL